MAPNRNKIKDRIATALERCFSERKTINQMLAAGLNEMVDAICDEMITLPPLIQKDKHENRSAKSL